MNIKERVDKIIEDNILTETEYGELVLSIEADGKIDAAENEQLCRLNALLESGQLTLVKPTDNGN